LLDGSVIENMTSVPCYETLTDGIPGGTDNLLVTVTDLSLSPNLLTPVT